MSLLFGIQWLTHAFHTFPEYNRSMLKALIFDFDGLILDTETPEVDVWTEIYAEHGFDFPFNDWVQTVGGYGVSNFDAAEHLSVLSQGRLDSASMRLRHRVGSEAVTNSTPVMPGVLADVARLFTPASSRNRSCPVSWILFTTPNESDLNLPLRPVLRTHGWMGIPSGLKSSIILTRSFVGMMLVLAGPSLTRICFLRR